MSILSRKESRTYIHWGDIPYWAIFSLTDQIILQPIFKNDPTTLKSSTFPIIYRKKKYFNIHTMIWSFLEHIIHILGGRDINWSVVHIAQILEQQLRTHYPSSWPPDNTIEHGLCVRDGKIYGPVSGGSLSCCLSTFVCI